MAWLKQGISALFLTGTLLQLWLAYPAVMSLVSPDVWLKVIQVCVALRTRTQLWVAVLAGRSSRKSLLPIS